MINFIHKFLYPHCEHCRVEKIEDKVCSSCEMLKDEIHRLRLENTKLLDSILNPKSNEPIQRVSTEDLKPLTSATIPWHTRRVMLENADRVKAELEQRARRAESRTDKSNSSTEERLEELEDVVIEGVK